MTMAWGWLGVVLFSARTAPAAPTLPSSWGENVWAQWGALFSAQALVAVVLSPLFATAMPPAELRSGWREGFPHAVLWRAASAAVWHQLIPAIVDHGSAGEAPPVILNGSRVMHACMHACMHTHILTLGNEWNAVGLWPPGTRRMARASACRNHRIRVCLRSARAPVHRSRFVVGVGGGPRFFSALTFAGQRRGAWVGRVYQVWMGGG